jgi:hypothetical protein
MDESTIALTLTGITAALVAIRGFLRWLAPVTENTVDDKILDVVEQITPAEETEE